MVWIDRLDYFVNLFFGEDSLSLNDEIVKLGVDIVGAKFFILCDKIAMWGDWLL